MKRPQQNEGCRRDPTLAGIYMGTYICTKPSTLWDQPLHWAGEQSPSGTVSWLPGHAVMLLPSKNHKTLSVELSSWRPAAHTTDLTGNKWPHSSKALCYLAMLFFSVFPWSLTWVSSLTEGNLALPATSFGQDSSSQFLQHALWKEPASLTVHQDKT